MHGHARGRFEEAHWSGSGSGSGLTLKHGCGHAMEESESERQARWGSANAHERLGVTGAGNESVNDPAESGSVNGPRPRAGSASANETRLTAGSANAPEERAEMEEVSVSVNDPKSANGHGHQSRLRDFRARNDRGFHFESGRASGRVSENVLPVLQSVLFMGI